MQISVRANLPMGKNLGTFINVFMQSCSSVQLTFVSRNAFFVAYQKDCLGWSWIVDFQNCRNNHWNGSSCRQAQSMAVSTPFYTSTASFQQSPLHLQAWLQAAGSACEPECEPSCLLSHHSPQLWGTAEPLEKLDICPLADWYEAFLVTTLLLLRVEALASESAIQSTSLNSM